MVILAIIGVEEAENIAKEFMERELRKNGRQLVEFRIASPTYLTTELNARIYIVTCEYTTFTLTPWKKQIVKVRATTGTVVGS